MSLLIPPPSSYQCQFPYLPLHLLLLVPERNSPGIAGRFCAASSACPLFLSPVNSSKSEAFQTPSSRRRLLARVIAQSATLAAEATSLTPFRSKDHGDVTILVVGSTGYVGKFVVRELVRRGFNVIALAREKSGIGGRNSKEATLDELRGTCVCFSDVTSLDALEESVGKSECGIDVVVSCLASRTGGVRDSSRVDYKAIRNSLSAGRNSHLL